MEFDTHCNWRRSCAHWFGLRAMKASQNKAKAKMLNTEKSAELDVKSAQLDAEGKKITAGIMSYYKRERVKQQG